MFPLETLELIDTHVHLGDAHFEEDRFEVIAAARKSGLVRLVEIADNPREWERAETLARRHPGLMAYTWGFHPHYAADWDDGVPERFKEAPASLSTVAVGEIGLDYVKSPASKEQQETVFRRMLALAHEVEKPIVIHCREAFEDLFRILDQAWKPAPSLGRFKGVVHCFTGNLEDARRAVSMGFALGVDGPVTYKKNDDLRAAFRHVGLRHLVLETDCPYLPPQSIRGKRNTPSSIPEIARKLAEVFEAPLEEIARQTTHNAKELFSL